MYVLCAKVKLLLTEFICLTFDYLLGVVAVVLARANKLRWNSMVVKDDVGHKY